jgi:hypothetical protein
MQADTQIKVSKDTAIVSMIVIFIMPMLQIVLGAIVTHTSLLSRIRESESFGFMTLSYLIACLLHSPSFLLLLLFIRFLRSCKVRRIIAMFVFLIIGFIMSGIYYIYWFIPFPWIKYFPIVLYAIVIIPLLSLGPIGTLKKAREVNKC